MDLSTAFSILFLILLPINIYAVIRYDNILKRYDRGEILSEDEIWVVRAIDYDEK